MHIYVLDTLSYKHTHTHTHKYIYIYINLFYQFLNTITVKYLFFFHSISSMMHRHMFIWKPFRIYKRKVYYVRLPCMMFYIFYIYQLLIFIRKSLPESVYQK